MVRGERRALGAVREGRRGRPYAWGRSGSHPPSVPESSAQTRSSLRRSNPGPHRTGWSENDKRPVAVHCLLEAGRMDDGWTETGEGGTNGE